MDLVVRRLNSIKFALAGLGILAWLLVFAAPATPIAANLIANPSVETANSSNSALPANWIQDKWGTNNASLTYQNGGHTGSKSLYVSMTTYNSGDAKWDFDPVAVNPGDSYTYSDYYQSSVATELDARYTNTSGGVSYAYLKTVPATASWSQTSATFTIPANAVNVSVLHILYSTGWLQTDDFSLIDNVGSTPPQVSVSLPSNNATVSGIQQISASASDSQGISSVQFKLDGNNLGPLITATPYSYAWDTTSVGNGNHTLTAIATDTTGLSTTSAAVTVNVQNQTTPPPPGSNLILNPSIESANPSGNPENWTADRWGTNTTTMSYQNGGHTGNKSLYINMTAWTSGDAKWMFSPVTITPGVSYNYSDYYQSNAATELDAMYTNASGNVTYAYLKTVPASSSWSQIHATFTAPAGASKVVILHILYGVGWLQTDDYYLGTSTVSTINITTPANNATVSGTTNITASVTPAYGVSVSSVQFGIDGVNLGSPVTTTPYQISWDSTKVANGSYNITAILTTSDNKTVTSSPIAVNVSNQIPNANLIPNPSLETVNPNNANLPSSWHSGHWGTNTTTFTYLTSGHTGQRSVEAQTTSYTSGSAYWFSNNISVTPGQMYDYSDYYESNVLTEIDAGFTMADGSSKDLYIGDTFASPNSWTKYDAQFTVPANAVSVQFFHNIYQVGWLTTDDYSLTNFSYQGLGRPIVSLTFDDGYTSFYNYGLPLLQKYGFLSTDYIISGMLTSGNPKYMTAAQVKSLNAAGEEIGSHTVTHPDLTTLSASNMDSELMNSQATLQGLLGVPVRDFATPYGAANDQVITDAKNYYDSVRGVESGYNAKNNFNPYNILVQNVVVTTPVSQVEQWIQQAQATNTWLVLVYHQVDPTLTNKTAEPYNTYPTDLDAELAYLKSTNVAVETVGQALAEITPQLGP